MSSPGQDPASSYINKSTRSPLILDGLEPFFPTTSDLNPMSSN
uniref:Uncharacterized protein n=1 Tax=Podoviridae sp. ct8Lf7 TaxID=2827723 RepID=A0A8S5S0X3_9CAUD|nr:MAG TPA: hypothetical protein [Podoviridae sp. ct8Lf7]